MGVFIYYSLDGTNWTQIGTDTYSGIANVYLELSKTSGDSGSNFYIDDYVVNLPLASVGYSDAFTGADGADPDVAKWTVINTLKIYGNKLTPNPPTYPSGKIVSIGTSSDFDVQCKSVIAQALSGIDAYARLIFGSDVNNGIAVCHAYGSNIIFEAGLIRIVGIYQIVSGGGGWVGTPITLNNADETVFLRITTAEIPPTPPVDIPSVNFNARADFDALQETTTSMTVTLPAWVAETDYEIENE